MNDIELIDDIQTRTDLATFVKNLSREYTENPKAWENDNLQSFLAALAAWIEDMEGYYLNQNQPIPSVPREQTRIERQTGLSGIHRDAAGIDTSDRPLVVARRPSPIPQRQSGLPMRLFANHLKIAKTL